MNTLLLWCIPPLVGAVIGYVTNAVAIKMLFRPLAEVRLFGIRLPFTPGILPRQRHKLAENIGAIVEQQLLTAEILIARLRQEDLRNQLKVTIAGYTEGLRKEAPRIASLLKTAAADAYPRAAKSFIAFLEKPEIHRQLEIHGGVFLNNAILKLNVFQRFFFSAGQFDKTLHDRMPEIIDDLIRQLDAILKDRDVQAKVLSHLVQTLQEAADGGNKEKLDSWLRDKALALAEEQSAALLRTINIKALVSARIDSLDMLQVEHIVLDVMANQLKWINVFGAILGALIGIFQSAFSWFIR
ncbi:hypothetical protein AGMMS49944_03470 [Spirochaetia bacterium]|nr:hypothetical protein AGMMS49944_03470 [Spirochaetia bacterium]